MVIIMRTSPTSLSELALDLISKKYFKTNIKELYPDYKIIDDNSRFDAETYTSNLRGFLKDPPFLGEYKLIIAHLENISLTNFKRIINNVRNDIEMKENFTLIFTTDKKEISSELEDLPIKNLEFLNINNPPDWLLKEYLIKQLPLGFNTEAYNVLKGRLAYHFNLLDFYIVKLQMLNKYIEVADVKKTIKTFKPNNLHKLEMFVFGYSNLKEVLKNIETYKYAERFLYNYLKDKLTIILKLKLLYLKGELNLTNINDFKNNKEFRNEPIDVYVQLFIYKISYNLMIEILSLLQSYKYKSFYAFLLAIDDFWRLKENE